MAKSKPTDRHKQKATHSAPADQVEATIAVIRRNYELGERILGRTPDGGRKDFGTIHQLAAEVGVQRNAACKAKKFADFYTRHGLEELIALRDPEGWPTTWTHVRKLILVEDQAARLDLQRRAVEGGWSGEVLDAEIRRLGIPLKRPGSGPAVGRRIKRPRTAQEALQRLVGMAETWLHYAGDDVVKAMLDRVGEVAPDEPTVGRRARLRDARAKLARLHRVARKLYRQLKEAEDRVQDDPPKSPTTMQPEPPRKGPRRRSAR